MGKGTRKLSNNLRELRQTRGGITQQELADRVGITRQTIIAIEGNRYSPSLEVAFMIAHALGARLEDVFHYGESAV
jgi:putative transcriptional regulator